MTTTYVVRVWLPDRPGALGAVASRIGAVRGDLIGIEILERGGGRAIDELVVSLPDAASVPLMVKEIGEVDGVDVEDVRLATAHQLVDGRLDALESVAELVDAVHVDAMLDTLVGCLGADLEVGWAVVLDPGATSALARFGSPPPVPWVAAFVAGSRSSTAVADGSSGPDDVAWAPLSDTPLALVVGRGGRPFRARERRQIATMARIGGRRWIELSRLDESRRVHPSAAV